MGRFTRLGMESGSATSWIDTSRGINKTRGNAGEVVVDAGESAKHRSVLSRMWNEVSFF